MGDPFCHSCGQFIPRREAPRAPSAPPEPTERDLCDWQAVDDGLRAAFVYFGVEGTIDRPGSLSYTISGENVKGLGVFDIEAYAIEHIRKARGG